jgi:hypothetical protein
MPSRKNSAAFDRCVRAVSKRKGVRSPGAVCAASERRRGLMNPSAAYRAGAAALRAGAARHGTVNLSPSLAQRDEWKHDWSQFMAGWNAAKKQRNPLPLAAAQALEGSTLAPYQKKAAKEAAQLQKKLGLKLNKGRRKNPRNPADAAAATYEGFHGRPSDEVVVIDTKIHEHKHVGALGELVALYVIPVDGRFEVKISGFGKGKHGAYLTMNENRTQLFIDGGDQRVKLSDFGISNPIHESEVLGELAAVDYYTIKDHLGSQGGEAVYNHKFKKSGRPFLVYDTRNGLLYVSGGKYTLPDEGITN